MFVHKFYDGIDILDVIDAVCLKVPVLLQLLSFRNFAV